MMQIAPTRHRGMMMNPAESASTPLLSVVMPVFNEAAYIRTTLEALRTAVAEAQLDHNVEVIVIDDGSTDDSSAEAASVWGSGISILTQRNRGRFESRRRGAASANGEFVLALDARSVLEPESLAFWSRQRILHPERLLWNGDTRIRSTENPYARFWDLLTGIGWREYIRNPRLVSFGIANFDRFPKGTGMFLAPRQVWEAAYLAVEERDRADLPQDLVSDDTALLRQMVEDGSVIWIDPDFSGEYVYPRRTLAAFVRNAFYRGGTFVDSYYEAPSGMGRLVRVGPAVCIAGVVAFGIAVFKHPKRTGIAATTLVLAPGVAVAAVAGRSGESASRSIQIGALSIPFLASFIPGLVRGYVARLRSRFG